MRSTVPRNEYVLIRRQNSNRPRPGALEKTFSHRDDRALKHAAGKLKPLRVSSELDAPCSPSFKKVGCRNVGHVFHDAVSKRAYFGMVNDF